MQAGAAHDSLGAEMLELARRIEGMNPLDVPCVQAHLRALQRAIEQADPRDIELEFSDTDDSASRLRSLVARISDDMAGGHVVAVTGLERQVSCYLRRRSGSGRASDPGPTIAR
jgi:hypothetical protein